MVTNKDLAQQFSNSNFSDESLKILKGWYILQSIQHVATLSKEVETANDDFAQVNFNTSTILQGPWSKSSNDIVNFFKDSEKLNDLVNHIPSKIRYSYIYFVNVI